jgi:apolipoprotein N-acyltransferase
MTFLAAGASALLLSFSLPNELASYGSPLLGLFALAPYFLAIGRSRSNAHAAWLGALFGGLAHASGSYWLYYFKDYAIWTIGATTIAYMPLQALTAVFIRFFMRRASGSLSGDGAAVRLPTMGGTVVPLRPFLIAAVWTVWEWRKAVGFLGYPWGLAGYALNEVPLFTQLVDTVGIYGLSFLVALVNAAAAEFVLAARPRSRLRPADKAALLRLSGAVLAVVAWFGLYGAWRLARPTPVVGEVPLVLVQHNADSWAQGELPPIVACQELTRRGLADLRAGKAALANGRSFAAPALVVWPESVLQRPLAEFPNWYKQNPPADPFTPFLAEIGVPLLTGAPIVLDWDTFEATNSAVLISPAGKIVADYAKRQLVPFAEGIPFWEFQWMRDFMKVAVGLEGGWTMGTKATVMAAANPSGGVVRFGVPICFEDAFGEVCDDFFAGGADALINITNDSWSRTASAEIQHLVAARFRAIENRATLIRATTAGVTAVVDAEGRTIAGLPLFEPAALAVLVPLQRQAEPTFYALARRVCAGWGAWGAQLGDWFAAGLTAALGVCLVAGFLQPRRRR